MKIITITSIVSLLILSACSDKTEILEQHSYTETKNTNQQQGTPQVVSNSGQVGSQSTISGGFHP